MLFLFCALAMAAKPEPPPSIHSVYGTAHPTSMGGGLGFSWSAPHLHLGVDAGGLVSTQRAYSLNARMGGVFAIGKKGKLATVMFKPMVGYRCVYEQRDDKVIFEGDDVVIKGLGIFANKTTPLLTATATADTTIWMKERLGLNLQTTFGWGLAMNGDPGMMELSAG
ncbi:MAG: hypothetical protein HN348_25710, partial [Proteobacteria bacterium]|nr:hypothetical protein [Pseudomonadota bacterium]